MSNTVITALSIARSGDGEAGELVEGEGFCPTAGIDIGGSAQDAGTVGTEAKAGREGIGQALSALSKRGEDDRAELRSLRRRHKGLRANAEVEDRRVDLRRRC